MYTLFYMPNITVYIYILLYVIDIYYQTKPNRTNIINNYVPVILLGF